MSMKLTEDDLKHEYANGFVMGGIVGILMTFVLLIVEGKL
jgi:hypothetical protein